MVICLVAPRKIQYKPWYERSEELVSANTHQECALTLFRKKYVRIETLIEFNYFKDIQGENEFVFNEYIFFFDREGPRVIEALTILYHNYLYYKFSNVVKTTPAIDDFLSVKKPKMFHVKPALVLTYGKNLINFYEKLRKIKPDKRSVLIIPNEPQDFKSIHGFHVEVNSTIHDISTAISEDLSQGVWEINFGLSGINYFAEVYLSDKIVIL